jgi:putative hydrolase of the HAD superfamily
VPEGGRRPPAAVLFDVDDTLVDFGGAARLALADVVQAHLAGDDADAGLVDAAHVAWHRVSEREYERFTRGEVDFDQMRLNRMAAFLAAIGRPGANRLSHELLEEHRNAAIFGHFRVFNDVPACLQRLHDLGVTVRVLSNSDGAYQRVKLAAVGLGDLGDTGFYSGELGFAKPDPRIFRAAAVTLGLRPDQIMYVGDRWEVDVLGSAAAGMRPVWLNRTGSARPSTGLRPLQAPVVEITSLAELDISA